MNLSTCSRKEFENIFINLLKPFENYKLDPKTNKAIYETGQHESTDGQVTFGYGMAILLNNGSVNYQAIHAFKKAGVKISNEDIANLKNGITTGYKFTVSSVQAEAALKIYLDDWTVRRVGFNPPPSYRTAKPTPSHHYNHFIKAAA